ncbi:MAG: hypothetical protein RMJ97_05305 [Raineya sp.]|nr:hypothetical protein [Raineya sp.]
MDMIIVTKKRSIKDKLILVILEQSRAMWVNKIVNTNPTKQILITSIFMIFKAISRLNSDKILWKNFFAVIRLFFMGWCKIVDLL